MTGGNTNHYTTTDLRKFAHSQLHWMQNRKHLLKGGVHHEMVIPEWSLAEGMASGARLSRMLAGWAAPRALAFKPQEGKETNRCKEFTFYEGRVPASAQGEKKKHMQVLQRPFRSMSIAARKSMARRCGRVPRNWPRADFPPWPCAIFKCRLVGLAAAGESLPLQQVSARTPEGSGVICIYVIVLQIWFPAQT